MSQDKKQTITTGEFDPARDIMFKLQDFWMKYKNVVVVVVLLISALTAWYGISQKAERTKTEAASNAYSLAQKEVAKDTTKAIELFMSVYDEHAGSHYARYSAFGIAELYLSQGEAEKSIEWFDNALAISGNDIIIDAESYEGQAVALEMLDKNDKAITLYEKVIALKSHRTKDVSMKLAYLLMKSGKADQAKSYCDKIVADSTVVSASNYNAQALLLEINATTK